MSNGTIFKFNAGARYGTLLARCPRNKIMTKIETVAYCGTMVIWTTCPISIRKGLKSECGVMMKEKAVVYSMLEVP